MDRLMDAIREFTTTILNPYDLQELLHRLTGHATAVTCSDGAGILLADGSGGLAFAAASQDRITQLETFQGRIETGPCHEAYSGNQLIVIDDLATTDRWPPYTARALELGLRSAIAVPMNAWGQTIGVVNIYRETAGPWTDTDVDAAETLTAMGTGYILHGNQLRAQHTLTEQLQNALISRDEIGQAKGMLMLRHGLDADEAFEMLRALSQSGNSKLRDVASGVIRSERLGSSAN
jgi:GAF domain-containing protein